MDLLALMFLAHLVGDYLLQNDTIAAKKVRPSFNPMYETLEEDDKYTNSQSVMWCALHCLLYTLSVAFFSLFSTAGLIPIYLLVFCFVTHFLIDHFRLARKYMDLVGQKKFATGFCAPWSVFIVDNTFHILTSWLIIVIMMV